MSVESHDIHEQDIGAYLLGALSDEEHTRFIRHLRTCHVCRDEVDRLQVAADVLPRSVTPLVAPASMKAAVMGEVEADVRGRSPRSPARRMLDRLPRLPSVPAKVASVTAAVLLVLGIAGGFGLSLVTGGGQERTITAKFDPDRIASGSGNLVIGGDDTSGGMLRVHGMPALRSNETYQVWLERDGEVIPKALFTVTDNGDGLTAVDDLDGADRVMVTREPAGGARSPSQKPIVTVAL